MSLRGTTLVVGGDGLIGGAVAARLRAGGGAVIATTRRSGAISGSDFRLDLADDPGGWPELPEVDAAVLCAAVARLGECEADPAASRRVNVDGALALARRLADRGSYVLLLSSDKVFDGTRPARTRGDARSPATEYGRQKSAAEQGLLALGPECAVLRLSKVLSPALELVRGWRGALEAGRTIAPFHDMYLAPVSVDFVSEMIIQLLAERRPGIFQASGDRDVSYETLARALADAVGADGALVKPVAAGPDLPPPARPRHSTLDMGLEARLFDLSQPESRTVCEEVAGAAVQVGFRPQVQATG